MRQIYLEKVNRGKCWHEQKLKSQANKQTNKPKQNNGNGMEKGCKKNYKRKIILSVFSLVENQQDEGKLAQPQKLQSNTHIV